MTAMADRRDFRKFLAVFRREFLERVRTRLFVATTLLGPLFFAAITIGPRGWRCASAAPRPSPT
jgi:hypothetical protein